LRLFFIQEIFFEFPSGVRCAKLVEPLLFRALVGERLSLLACRAQKPGDAIGPFRRIL